MSFKGITITTPEESLGNITAADDAAIFQSLIGSDGVLNIGSKFAATVISNNKVRVADGVLCVGGHMGRTAYGDYNDMTIENGVSGQNRNDIIYAKFLTSGSSDTFTLAVKKGTGSTGTAEDPALVQGDLYENATLREIPLWRVQLEGLSITVVEQMFEAIPTIPELKKDKANASTVNVINNKLSAGYIAGTGSFRYKGEWESMNVSEFKLAYIISDGGTPAIMIPCCIDTGTAALPYIVKNSSGNGIFQYFVAAKRLYIYVLNNANTVGVSFIL